MKNQLKKLKDINFLTKLTLSEQERINGGNTTLTSDQEEDPSGRSTGGMLPPPPPPPPTPDGSVITDTRYKSSLTS
jgi:hypothetical protein